jgi:endonuclease-3 related protein
LTPRQRLEICVGAILTQNTNWSNVKTALANLADAGIRDLEHFQAVSAPRLEKLIRSSGYYRQKTVKLKCFVRHLAGRGGAVQDWLAGDLALRRRELLGLYGIGPETADSILLYAAQRPAFVVDAYTLRVGARLGWWREASYERAQDLLVSRLPRRAEIYNEFHALIVRLAKEHCRKAPACPGCPLREDCRHGRAG